VMAERGTTADGRLPHTFTAGIQEVIC
jgi:hypothetical protein